MVLVTRMSDRYIAQRDRPITYRSQQFHHRQKKRTRSPAVARIADRTASQQTVVIIAIVLIGLVYL